MYMEFKCDQTIQLNKFETLLFENIQKVFCLCREHGGNDAILDDESFGCHAKDNQVKSLLNN